ncbi:MAG: hypothetical protein HY714_00140 [Candidatus Omnitrophica bacterium]|nr:hypothetical protein [Candidatus Omnitrophota bacterium]
MTEWEKDFSKIKLLVFFIYGGIGLYAVIVQTVPFASPGAFPADFIFHLLLAAAAAQLIASFAVAQIVWGGHKIEGKRALAGTAESKVRAALASARSGALISAASGETAALCGVFYYFLTGDPSRPWLFFLLGGLNYFATSRYLSGAHEAVLKVSRGY